MDDVTSHHIVPRSSLIRHTLQVGARGLGRDPSALLLLEASLAEDEVSSLDGALSPDSRYPESSDDISAFLLGTPLRSGLGLFNFSSTPDTKESDELDDCSSMFLNVKVKGEGSGAFLLDEEPSDVAVRTFLPNLPVAEELST